MPPLPRQSRTRYRPKTRGILPAASDADAGRPLTGSRSDWTAATFTSLSGAEGGRLSDTAGPSGEGDCWDKCRRPAGAGRAETQNDDSRIVLLEHKACQDMRLHETGKGGAGVPPGGRPDR